MVDPAKLRKCLTAGATLVINNLHEMLPKVIDGAHELGRAVGERIQGNLYATWGKTHGFKPHWDDHDVLIVQIQGSKKWDIYGPGKPWPLDHTDDADNTRPSAPVWSGTLTPGDVLYLPRGWWHNVGGTGNATVHLTFGFQRRTAMNYITWLIDKLPENEIFRMDLPRDQVEQHQNAISEAIGSALNEHSMKEYLSEFSCQLDREAPSPLTLESVRAEQNVTIDPC